MQRISVRLQRINATVTNNYTCYKTIWWQSQTLDWVHPHKHQHGTILYTYYTIIILPACSGIRHEQYTCKVDDSFTLAALLLLWVTGNAEMHCASKKCIKCLFMTQVNIQYTILENGGMKIPLNVQSM